MSSYEISARISRPTAQPIILPNLYHESVASNPSLEMTHDGVHVLTAGRSLSKLVSKTTYFEVRVSRLPELRN